MMAKADKDATIAGTRPEGFCTAASGGLSPWVSLSGVSATCVPYVPAQSQDFPRRRSAKPTQSRHMENPATSAICPPKFGLNHGLIWLRIGYAQASRV